MKRRVKLNNKTIGKIISINNSIKKKEFTPLILDRMSTDYGSLETLFLPEI
tara:strand:+ start:280 stop:432 length:153 start_codon:yes stop_codon:yes gene_type:complete